jgi:hypothetical protein
MTRVGRGLWHQALRTGAHRCRRRNLFDVGVLFEVKREPVTESIGEQLRVFCADRLLEVRFDSLELRCECGQWRLKLCAIRRRTLCNCRRRADNSEGGGGYDGEIELHGGRWTRYRRMNLRLACRLSCVRPRSCPRCDENFFPRAPGACSRVFSLRTTYADALTRHRDSDALPSDEGRDPPGSGPCWSCCSQLQVRVDE